jgi:hypothetical protein
MVTASFTIDEAGNHFAWIVHTGHFRGASLMLSCRKISAIFAMSYANAVYKMLWEVNNRLRKPDSNQGSPIPGEYGCRLGGLFDICKLS